MEKIPKVFIIILAYNGGKLLENCLKSLKKVDYSNFHIVVVDNNSTDNSVEKIEKKFPQVAIVKNKKNIGFAAGNNIGIKYTLEKGADYVLLLNQDTEVEPNFLTELIKEGEKNSQAGLLSPLIFWKRSDQVWFSSGRINWLNMKTYHKTSLIQDRNLETSFLTGCSLLIKRSVLEKVGLLDEDFFLYWEDVDYSLRARKAGFRMKVIPESIVHHFESSNKLNKSKVYWLVLSGLIFFEKNSAWFLRPWLWFFVKLRKFKNWVDRRIEIFKNPSPPAGGPPSAPSVDKLGKGEDVAEGVSKAYKDFELWRKRKKYQ